MCYWNGILHEEYCTEMESAVHVKKRSKKVYDYKGQELPAAREEVLVSHNAQVGDIRITRIFLY